MTREIVVAPNQNTLTTEIITLANQAREFQRASVAENTVRAYRIDWDHWVNWCAQHLQDSTQATPDVVALYVTSMAGDGKMKLATIKRRIAGISAVLKMQGKPAISIKDEPLKSTLAGIERTIGTSQRQAAALLTEHIAQMIGALPVHPAAEVQSIDDPAARQRATGARLRNHRDRALILVGYAAALRRSEIAALNLGDIKIERDGMTVIVRKSKTDQGGEGAEIGVVYGSNPDTCPVRAVIDWLSESGITTGALFPYIDNAGRMHTDNMDGKSVGRIIQRTAEAAGINLDDISGHSLRAGFATQAARNGASETQISYTTRHKTLEVLQKYIRRGNLYRDNASSKLGL